MTTANNTRLDSWAVIFPGFGFWDLCTFLRRFDVSYLQDEMGQKELVGFQFNPSASHHHMVLFCVSDCSSGSHKQVSVLYEVLAIDTTGVLELCCRNDLGVSCTFSVGESIFGRSPIGGSMGGMESYLIITVLLVQTASYSTVLCCAVPRMRSDDSVPLRSVAAQKSTAQYSTVPCG